MTAGKQMRCKRKGCGRRFTRPAGSRRVNCYECRPARGALADATIAQFPPAQRDESIAETVVELTKLELLAAGRLGTRHGMVAVRIAERIDAGSHTMAQDVKALREQMDIALAGTEDRAGEVDNVFFDDMTAELVDELVEPDYVYRPPCVSSLLPRVEGIVKLLGERLEQCQREVIETLTGRKANGSRRR